MAQALLGSISWVSLIVSCYIIGLTNYSNNSWKLVTNKFFLRVVGWLGVANQTN
jgi:hypothetical protein